MIGWFLSVSAAIRDLDEKARDALELLSSDEEADISALKKYMEADYQRLWDLWRAAYPDENLGHLGRHIHFAMLCDFDDITRHDLPDLRTRAEEHLQKAQEDGEGPVHLGFEELLHPVIMENAFQLYRNGHLREAVLNSVTAVFDLIRQKSGVPEDGDRLVGKVFSLDAPVLVLSELQSESGQNDQKGFMQIFKGAYQGIRNPKAHSLTHDLNELKAAQYLVFSSLLARRIDEATAPSSRKRTAPVAKSSRCP